FENANVPHIYETLDPNRDLDSLNAELALTDLASVEKRIERSTKAAKSGDKKYLQEIQTLQMLREALNDLRLVSQIELDSQGQALLKELFLLTVKPRMYVLNVSEDILGEANELLEKVATGSAGDISGLSLELQ